MSSTGIGGRGAAASASPELERQSFAVALEPLLHACPGPPLAKSGLRMVALQQVAVIPPSLPASAVRRTGYANGWPARGKSALPPEQNRTESSVREVVPGGYIWSVEQIAARLGCSPSYLSKGARSHGYSLARAFTLGTFPPCRGPQGGGVPGGDDGSTARIWRRSRVESFRQSACGPEPSAASGGSSGFMGSQGGERRILWDTCLGCAAGRRAATRTGKDNKMTQNDIARRLGPTQSCPEPVEAPPVHTHPRREGAR